MKTRVFLFYVALTTLITGCSFVRSHQIRGGWQLQEVQIPLTEDFLPYVDYDNYADLFITDETIEVRDSQFNFRERWEYTINNDSVLTIISGGYKSFVIKELSKERLVLAENQTLHGCMVYIFVPYGTMEGPIKHTKQPLPATKPDPNPIVNRLSQSEISKSKTPAAVAYNFVRAIYDSDSKAMLSYLTKEAKENFESQRQADGNQNYDSYFSEPGSKLNIKGWEPAINTGDYEIAVLYVQEEGFDDRGRTCKKVYVGCVPSSEVGSVGFQDITRYGDTNVKVLVIQNKKKWQVIGFK